MIYQKFIPVILYLVEAFVPPLDGDNDYINVQNSLDDKGTGNALKTRQKRQATSNHTTLPSDPKSRFRVAKNKRGTEIQCKDDHQCQEILDGAGECIKGRCIVQFCEVDDHCPDDRHKCHEQVCIVLEKCRADEDCGPGFVCEDEYCMPDEPEGECKEDEDCPNEVSIFCSTFC